MDFALSDELAELQQTVRRLAQDKVKPRAREIDETNEYPEDLFELFRDAGLLGLVIPTEYGGAGAGIPRRPVAPAGGGKNSKAAAPGRVRGRPPPGPRA